MFQKIYKDYKKYLKYENVSPNTGDTYLIADRQYHKWYPIFVVLLWTGMRVGEITGLRWCDIEDGIIDVPITDPETYKNIVIPNFIRCGAIPKAQLEVGKTYIGSCRNAREAIWKGDHFTYKRYKFGCTFDEDINHFEDDNGYDLFVPIKLKEDE